MRLMMIPFFKVLLTLPENATRQSQMQSKVIDL